MPTTSFNRTLNYKAYELNDHLGNVMVNVADWRKGYDNNADGIADVYRADHSNGTDYFPFGMIMPGRNNPASSTYRFGFNGKEKDDEIDQNPGTEYNYGMRIYDPRLGKFLSVDPLQKQFPFFTPYQFSGNSPIVAVDLDGKEPHDYKDNYDHMDDQQEVTIYNQDVDLIYDHSTHQFFTIMQYPGKPDEYYYLARIENGKYSPNSAAIWGAADNMSTSGDWTVYWQQFTPQSLSVANAKAAEGFEKILLGSMAAVVTAPLVVDASVEYGLVSLEKSLSNAIAGSASNLTAQYFTKGGDINKINWVSVASNGVCANPFTANLVGNVFEISGEKGAKITDDDLPTVAFKTGVGTGGSVVGGFLSEELKGVATSGFFGETGASTVLHLFGDAPAEGVNAAEQWVHDQLKKETSEPPQTKTDQ